MIPRKKSRLITVGGLSFRYTIKTGSRNADEVFELFATIRIANGNGAVLRVGGLVTRDYWLDFPHPSDDEKDYPVLTPRHIEKFIRTAMHTGWKPEVSGPVYILKLENKEVFN